MTEFDIVNLISTLGFPTAITIWMLFKGSKVLENNTNALNELKIIIKSTHK